MIKVKLFGMLRIDSGLKETKVAGDRVKDLYGPVPEVSRQHDPDTAVTMKTLNSRRIAVNGVAAIPATKLQDVDTVYLFPAVAGG